MKMNTENVIAESYFSQYNTQLKYEFLHLNAEEQ